MEPLDRMTSDTQALRQPLLPVDPEIVDPEIIDVIVVGAGLAGLVCAQQLQRTGLRVVVVEKSRGLGGRLATRRLEDTCADHGLRYLTEQGALTGQLISHLLKQNRLQPWIEVPTEFLDRSEYQPGYSAATGLTAVAKWLATGLAVWLGQRVDRLSLEQDGQTPIWLLELLPGQAEAASLIRGKAVVLAIPAPQAQALVEPLLAGELAAEFADSIRAVKFVPCITAIARYDTALLDALSCLPQGQAAATADIAWFSQEQTKGRAPVPVLVLQSTSEFAERHLEAADLTAVGHLLLDQLVDLEPKLSPLQQPLNLQMHRWRYGLVQQPWPNLCLTTALPAPLACSGDWCGGNNAEAALASGLATAAAVRSLLDDRLEPDSTSAAAQFSLLLDQIQQDQTQL
jgi:renalase